jgi:xylan 1,4-beta-xylosidase
MSVIRNPILPGFHPDPSFLRVGDEFYIATSTFEWFPGVVIHHSRDLVHWRLIGHALTRTSHLDLSGVTDSGGVWAPSMSFHAGLFYLIYTNVRTRVGPFKDVGIFLTTATEVGGPWTDPIPLSGGGFDPSLFHDDDGRKWLVNIEWDHRKGQPSRFGGIVMQEYEPRSQRLVGPITKILQKPELIEGPNLYKRNGWYYLMLAEGGTGWNHGISMARARSITGPYEVDPRPVMTSRHDEKLPLQKAGHGELVETQSDAWYLAHLASRPIGAQRRCVLGRETCLQRVRWTDDGWLRLHDDSVEAKLDVPAPAELVPHPWPAESPRDDFDRPTLTSHWSSLRVPVDESWATLRERPGWMRLRGRDSQHSLFEQSLLARRLQSFIATAQTCVEFEPAHFTQSAGLICWYDTRTHFYLRVTHDERRGGRVLDVVMTDDGVYDELLDSQIAIGDWPRIHLRAYIDHERLQFSASPDGLDWQLIGPLLDATKLSDDYGQGLHFTGAMIGVCAQDLRGTRTPVDFDYFDLRVGS